LICTSKSGYFVDALLCESAVSGVKLDADIAAAQLLCHSSVVPLPKRGRERRRQWDNLQGHKFLPTSADTLQNDAFIRDGVNLPNVTFVAELWNVLIGITERPVIVNTLMLLTGNCGEYLLLAPKPRFIRPA
jgi:hypothetical protein